MSREVEWEFTDHGGGRGSFAPSGSQTGNTIRGHLSRAEVDQALALYESSVENVGDQLMCEFENESNTLQKSLATLFYRARDYRRAAAACMKLGEWAAAGKSFEACFDYDRAARCYVKAEQHEQAAACWVKAKEFRQAADVYRSLGQFGAAAAAMHESGDPLTAAQLAVRGGDQASAARYLAQVPSTDERYLSAVLMLGELLVQLGRSDLAVQRMQAAMPKNGKIRDAATARVAYKLAELLLSENNRTEAARYYSMLRDLDANYEDVSEKLALAMGGAQSPIAGQPALGGDSEFARAVLDEPSPHSGSAVSSIPVQSMPPVSAPPAGSVEPVFDAPMRAGAAAAVLADEDRPPSVPDGFVVRMEDYELLKTMPLFEDLSLDEMRNLYQMCETVQFAAGDLIIEQGQQDIDLLIIREGSVDVTQYAAGKPIHLTTMPAKTYVGEMSIVDNEPASARVTAGPRGVSAFRIPKVAFRQYLEGHDTVALRIYQAFTRTLVQRLREANLRLAQFL